MVTSDSLKRLCEPFPAGDIEWRVVRAIPWGQNIRCFVYPYVTARAIHQRLDEVVGPENWCNTSQSVIRVAQMKSGQDILSVQVGISIRIGDEWITKYNVSEATDVEPAKGAFSGAEKRAGEEWGIGRYLWFLGEMDAETKKDEVKPGPDWMFGQLPEKYEKQRYWWKAPKLPAWALPADPGAEARVTSDQLNEIKKYWANKLAPDEKNRAVKSERFTQLVVGMFGPVPVDQPSGWTQDMLSQVRRRIDESSAGGGPSPDVPFG